MTHTEASIPPRFDPTIPLHHQAYLYVRRQIDDGLWIGRTDFPGERELAEQLGVSVITSRAALDRLSSEGLIERQRGRRPRVTDAAHAHPASTQQDQLMPTGPRSSYEYDVLRSGIDIAPAEACRAFGMEPGSSLWQCSRIRRSNGDTHSVTLNAQRPELGERHSQEDLRSKPMVAMLAKAGQTITKMRRYFSISTAPDFVTTSLDLTIASPVLLSTFTLHNSDDDLVQWVRIYLHPSFTTPLETMDLAERTWSSSSMM